MTSCGFVSLVHLTLACLLACSTRQINGQQTCLEPYCSCVDAYTLRCSNFTRFDELDFRRTNNRIFKIVEIRPVSSQLLDLNERLTFHGLRLSGRLSISNIGSFNAFYNPFRQIVYDRLDISFFNSHFRFVGAVGSSGNQHAEQTLIDNCELTAAAVNFDFVFSDLNVNEFVMCNIYYPKTMCPIFFRNSNIKNMIVNDPTGAFGFSQLHTANNDAAIYVLNTNINQIDFTYSAENVVQPQWLDADYIINPELFVRTDRINLNAARRLSYIKEDTFQRLSGLRKFELNNVPLKDLLTYNRQWLKHLNYHMIPFDLDYVSLNQSIGNNVFQLLIWVSNDNDWNFNDERDICLFRDFPHHRLVFPFLLFSKTTLPCTCTIYWLYKYFNRYQQLYNLNQDVVPLHCFKNSNWDRCHFETLFQKYCPRDKPDPDESYTTLKPSVDYLPSTTCCTPTNPTVYPTLEPTYPTLYPTNPTYPTGSTPVYTTSTTSMYLTSSSSYLIDFSKCSFSTVAFYLAIALSIVAAFIIAALVILYYKVCRQKQEDEEEEEEQNVTQPNEIEIGFEAELSEPGDTNKKNSSGYKAAYKKQQQQHRSSIFLPRQLIVADLVVDTSFCCNGVSGGGGCGACGCGTGCGLCAAAAGGGNNLGHGCVSIPQCNGTCADCNAPIYI